MRIISLTLLFIPLISWSQKIMPEGYSDKDYIINFSNDTIFTSFSNTNGVITSSFHYEVGGCCDGCWTQCPDLSILGWSKNGIIAYISPDGYDMVFTIQDLRSDKILETKLIGEYEISAENQDSINYLLNLYSIISNQKSNYYSEIKDYDVDLTQKHKQSEGCIVSQVSYKINISHANYGDKNIAKGVFDCISDIGVFGYFKSPYENRFFIVLWYVPEVVETEYFHLIGYGSSLDPGTFK